MRTTATHLTLAYILLFGVACGDDDGGDDDTVDASAQADAADSPDGAPSADAPAATTYSLTLTLMGYGMAHNGDTLYFSLWDDADTDGAVATTEKEIMSGGGGGGGGGGNNIELIDALVEGHSYTLYWYADINANMMCDMDTDHHWSLAIPNVTADVETSHQHTLTFNGDCTKQ